MQFSFNVINDDVGHPPSPDHLRESYFIGEWPEDYALVDDLV